MSNIKTYTPTPSVQQPGVAPSSTGQHFGLPWLNPEGSGYASTYSKTTNDLIAKYIEKNIFDSTNEQYAALYTFMYNKPIELVPSDEFNYKEKIFGRSALTVYGWVHGTGVVTLAGTYASANDIGVSVRDIVALPNNKKAIVSAVTWSASANASTVTLVAYTGVSFAAGDMTAGDTLSLESAAYTDGMNDFSHYDRMQTINRTNYIQMFHRARRWGLVEYIKMMNNATTNYIPMDKENSLEQLRTDMLATWLNGTLGEVAIPSASGSYPAKMMNGVYPSMVAAGAPSASVTASGIQASIETLGFQTNRLGKGKTRMLLGTDAMLHEVAKQFKNPIDYTPNDTIANLNLKQYEIGTMKFVPIVVPQMGDASILPSFYKNMIMCVDMDSMTPVGLSGLPKVIVNQTKDVTSGLTTNGYNDWYVITNMSMKYHTPAAGFYINVL